MSAIIHVRGLTKSFGALKAVDDLDLTVQQGTVLGLLGLNGSGKTTTVSILTALQQADAGTATIAGVDLTTSPQDVRRQIGLSGQFAAVDEYLTGFENLEMIGRLYRLGRRRAGDPRRRTARDPHVHARRRVVDLRRTSGRSRRSIRRTATDSPGGVGGVREGRVPHPLVNGSWIHTRSLVPHHGTVTLGDAITIETTVVDRFTSRAGKRAIADVRITSGGRPVASIEHEAVIEVTA
jgi:hypothetical protein